MLPGHSRQALLFPHAAAATQSGAHTLSPSHRRLLLLVPTETHACLSIRNDVTQCCQASYFKTFICLSLTYVAATGSVQLLQRENALRKQVRGTCQKGCKCRHFSFHDRWWWPLKVQIRGNTSHRTYFSRPTVLQQFQCLPGQTGHITSLLLPLC